MTLLTYLVLPSGFACVLFILGLLACFWARTKVLSWWLLVGSGAVITIFSSGMVAAALTSPLEYSQPVLHMPDRHPQARHIVVLTAWASDDKNMPLSGRLSASAAYRVLHTLELYRSRPDCDVIVSGSATPARIMGDVLYEVGVPRERLRFEDKSNSTAESAAYLRTFVRDEPFFLVTSAGHMPRSIAAFRRHGLRPIPAPTDHQLPKDWWRAEWMPRAESLVTSNLAVHEMLGLLWYRLTDRA